jgi:hypothetical protein
MHNFQGRRCGQERGCYETLCSDPVRRWRKFRVADDLEVGRGRTREPMVMGSRLPSTSGSSYGIENASLLEGIRPLLSR